MLAPALTRWYRTIMPLANAWTIWYIRMYRLGLGLIVGHDYLLLETVGRRTGRQRVTPLGYIHWCRRLILQPLHGPDSDWLLNLQAHPIVTVLVGRRSVHGTARILGDANERRAALEVVSSSWTPSGITARKHFSLLRNAGGEALEKAAHDLSRPIVVVELG